MTGKNQHVVPHQRGWAVKGAGNQRATGVRPTQQAAIDRRPGPTAPASRPSRSLSDPIGMLHDTSNGFELDLIERPRRCRGQA
mgnify:CR=1 FL=1